MADGDATAGTAAAAIGLAVMTGLEKVKDVWRFMNSTRDMIANHITSGVHTMAQITGLTAALASLAASMVGNANAGTNVIQMKYTGSTPQIVIDATTIDLRRKDDGNFGSTPIYTPNGRSSPVTTSYVAAYINSDGRIGATPSSKRFKVHVRDYEAPDKFWDLQPVVFYMKEDPERVPRIGFYAEDANKVEPLLVVHEKGRPFSIRYETWATALHAATRARFEQLEARIAELEGKSNA